MSTKSISQEKLEANRRNAQKSTGPKTPEGKARSSRNALKHGLLAKCIVLREDDPHENALDFEQLLESLAADLRPEGASEQILVEQLATCYWRLRRAYRFEANDIDRLRDLTEIPSSAARRIRGTRGCTSGPGSSPASPPTTTTATATPPTSVSRVGMGRPTR